MGPARPADEEDVVSGKGERLALVGPCRHGEVDLHASLGWTRNSAADAAPIVASILSRPDKTKRKLSKAAILAALPIFRGCPVGGREVK
jgi:hypothetical protein